MPGRIGLGMVIVGRWILHQARGILQSLGFVRDAVLVVGNGDAAQLVVNKIKGSSFLGYRLLGLVADGNGTGPAQGFDGLPVLGCTEDLPRLIDENSVDEVIIAMPEADDEEMLRVASLAHRERVSLKVFPTLFEIMAAGVTIDDLGGLPLLSIRDVALRGWKLSVKRAIDLIGSAARPGGALAVPSADRDPDQARFAWPGFLCAGAHGPGRASVPHVQVPLDEAQMPRPMARAGR